MVGKVFLLPLLMVLATAAPGRTAPVVETTYEPALIRLSEILGSLHFLANLCGDKGDRWRSEMEKLLDSEKPDADRRARLIENFNRGYRSFELNYSNCTASADEAIKLYRKEGAALTREVAAQFGN